MPACCWRDLKETSYEDIDSLDLLPREEMSLRIQLPASKSAWLT
jgi:hypothetical protein